jgi:hypothetical protein
VYERDIRNVQTGAAIDTAAVGANSTVTFAGLDNDLKLIATDGTVAVRFGTLTDPDTGGGGGGDVTTEDLEAAIAAHAGDTTSVHGISDTAFIKGVAVDTDGGVLARPDFLSVEFVQADDPDSLAEDGDTWTPTEA